MLWRSNFDQMLVVEIRLTSSWRGRRSKAVDSWYGSTSEASMVGLVVSGMWLLLVLVANWILISAGTGTVLTAGWMVSLVRLSRMGEATSMMIWRWTLV